MSSSNVDQLNGIHLTDIIGLALNRETYEQLRDAIQNDRSVNELTPIANSPLARNHRAKLLREEATKQFSHGLRSVIELIVNGVDAKPEDHSGDYFVDVRTSSDSLVIQDSGKGMSLDNVLTTLLIPFSSDKREGKDIGRFGVGFFSSLGYCLSNPGKIGLELSTSKDRRKYNLKFGSKNKDMDSLVCQIAGKTGFSHGTEVKVGFGYKQRELIDYIEDYLSFFDPKRAKIRVNGKVINPEPKNVVYQIPVKFDDEHDSSCRVAIERTRRKGKNSLFSQGVYVRSGDFPDYNIKIDLPSNVLLVEGRDEFKHDENYSASLKSIVDYVCKHGKDITRDIDPDFDVKDFLVSLVYASDLSPRTFKNVIEDNLDNLFLPGTHILYNKDMTDDYINAVDFFGKEINPRLYVPQTSREFNFWKNFLPGYFDLAKSETLPLPKMNAMQLPNFPPELADFCKEQARRFDTKLHLVRLKNPTDNTRSPFFGDSSELYLNVDHPMIREPSSSMSRYLTFAYLRRIVDGEKGCEGGLISG